MKAIIVFTAIRLIELGEPEEGQDEKEFLQVCKEGVESDPFSFIDVPVEDIQVAVLLEKAPK